MAFMVKETLQMVRDPSSLLIAVVLPVLMIFLFCYGVSLDTNTVKIGVVQEDFSAPAKSLVKALQNTPYFDVTLSTHREQLLEEMVIAHLRAVVIIPQDFSAKLDRENTTPIQVISDGTEPNPATFAQNYAQGVATNWWNQWQLDHGIRTHVLTIGDPRMWFNPELKSRYVLLPGSIAVILSLIGILLTALVMSREWERGTMEAVLATPILMSELILGKLLPYFFLGMGSMTLCVLFAVFVFGVPFVGSFGILALASALFLFVGLNQGLLISILAKNQFVASQAAINAAFLPAYMLSGFLYEIESMPKIFQGVTYLLPARYFVKVIQTSFLSGVIWPVIIPNLLAMLVMGMFFLWLVTKKSKKQIT
jgi:ABC-2 type transport system permease protein